MGESETSEDLGKDARKEHELNLGDEAEEPRGEDPSVDRPFLGGPAFIGRRGNGGARIKK